jgi:hypothetical protein
MLRFSILLATGFAAAALAKGSQGEAGLPPVVQFNRDVRPIMANTCFKCHGPDLKANKANLRIDLRDDATRERTDKTGHHYTPIVPGKPEASEVWRRVSSSDTGVAMPPPDSLHLLSPRDREILKLWIAQGAKYEPHWAYIEPRKVALPEFASRPSNPIDAFILKELSEHGIAPSPEADRRTLIRRLSLDLIGLPPSVRETEEFMSDPSPDAYARLVDRLLASPHYGERMATGWLDLARFADTVGFHGDQQFNDFPYRDYVIDAFNRNEPYDQFTREQIAGDLLPEATDRQRVASGFNRLNMVTREGGAQPKEYLARYAADRVRTVSTVWLGSTMGCCECHDHKFDPFKSRDFYSMAAYFADVKQWGVYADYDYTPEPDLAGFTNDFPFPPEIQVDSPYLKARLERLSGACRALSDGTAKAVAADPIAAAAAREWAGAAARELGAGSSVWKVLHPAAATPRHDGSDGSVNGKAAVTVLPDESVRIEFVKDPGGNRSGDSAVVTLAAAVGPVSRVRLEALPDPFFGGRVTNLNAGGFFARKEAFSLTLELAVMRAGKDAPEPVKFADAYPNQAATSYVNGHLAASVLAEWRSDPGLAMSAQSADYILSAPLVLGAGDRLVATVRSEDVGRVRFSVSPLGVPGPGAPADAEVLGALGIPAPAGDAMVLIADAWIRATGAGQKATLTSYLSDMRGIAECAGGRATSIVTVATTPLVTRVLHRGDWQDQTGDVVSPAPPAFLPGGGVRPGAPRQTRLDLANWLVAPDNPLTSRAFVNRTWKQFFGTGLSAIVDDLGFQGEYPSHPELLDWLAVDFVESGWDVKALVRRIVTSETYRRSSRYRPELADADPNNRLLARQTPRRLEAEFVRDNALAAAGLINLDIGGPSAFPYQPEGYYAALQFPDREYAADTDERQFRRGVYMHWQRTFLHPMLANFDAPSREECTASRIVSSTPQQALTLLNDPTFVEAARGLAEEALTARPGGSFADQLDEAFLRLLSRPADERERSSLEAFYAGQLAYYRGNPAEAGKLVSVGIHPAPAGLDPATLAAWTSVARVLVNLNESIVRY